ncbi:hypothetical protein L2K20_09970 [Mycobacterium sp. MBM]|nr:hypothetical protein [Mycobacterium sp. MBM]
MLSELSGVCQLRGVQAGALVECVLKVVGSAVGDLAGGGGNLFARCG